MQCNPWSYHDRRGLTLMELLVVITIMMIMAAVAIPMLRPAIEGRQIREAARSVVVYFASARTRAIETGRPVGVYIQRMPERPQAGTVLQQVKIPPPYSGDSYDAAVRVVWTGTFDRLDGAYYLGPYEMDTTLNREVLVERSSGDPVIGMPVVHVFPVRGVSPKTFRPWDKIQFDNKGPWYTILPKMDFAGDNRTPGNDDTSVDSDGYVDVTRPFRAMVDMPPASPHPWPMDINTQRNEQQPYPYHYYDSVASKPLSFEILRQPHVDPSRPAMVARRSTTPPLHLSKDVAVDLSVSGTESNPIAFHWSSSDLKSMAKEAEFPSPVLIIFSPTGSVDRVCYQNQMSRVTDSIYLLVGERNRVDAPFPPPYTSDPTTLPGPLPGVPDPVAGWMPPGDRLPNWVNPISRWVALRPQSGRASVSKGASVPLPNDDLDRETVAPQQGDMGYFDWKDATTWEDHIIKVRQFARSAEGEGGR